MQRSELTANFPADVLELLAQTDEVQIEPRSPDGQRQRAVTVWVVVLDGLDVYIRSYRGPRGRWYQALLKHPYGVLRMSHREIPFDAIHIDDSLTTSRRSDAYRRKYDRN